MDDQGSSGLEKNGKGSLDVDAELSSIEKFKSLGMDTEGMEELLFTNIGEYKKRKLELLRHEIHNGLMDDDLNNEYNVDGSIDLIDITENDEMIPEEPQVGDNEDDLLLLDLSINDDDIPEGPNMVDLPVTEQYMDDISNDQTADPPNEPTVDTIETEPITSDQNEEKNDDHS